MNCVAHVGFHHWHVNGLVLRWIKAFGNALAASVQAGLLPATAEGYELP